MLAGPEPLLGLRQGKEIQVSGAALKANDGPVFASLHLDRASGAAAADVCLFLVLASEVE